jgi:phage terminase large subunit
VPEIKVQIPDIFRELFSPIRYKGYHGGRGSGKSTAFADALLIMGQRRRMRILCCREVQNSIKDSVKHLLDKEFARFGMDNFYYSTREEIRGINGTQFIFKGLRSDTETIKSYEDVDVAWIEEAQSISDKSLIDLKNTIRKDGSEIWASWNPRRRDDPIDMFLHDEDGANPDPMLIKSYKQWSVVQQVNYHDNPFFPNVLQVEMERDRARDPGRYRHIWLGEYLTRSEAQVIRNWRVGSVAEIMRARSESLRFYFGCDFGYASDPSVLVRCFVVDRTLYIDHEAVAHHCEIDDLPALFAGDDFELPSRWLNRKNYHGVPQALRWPIIADSARADTIAYLKRRGFDIHPAQKGSGSIEDGIEFLCSFDIVVSPNCTNAIEELSTYSYKIDKHTNEILPILEDRNNHVIDSLRYALEGTRRATYDSSLAWVGDIGISDERDGTKRRSAVGVL